MVNTKGSTINDLGVGLEEIEKKKFFEGARPGKNKFQKAFLRKKKFLEAFSGKK